LDDTLYAERDYVHSGWMAVARWAAGRWGGNAPDIFAAFVAIADRVPPVPVFDTWLAEAITEAEPKTCAQAMVEIYRGHIPSIALDRSVQEMLTELRHRYRLGIVTDGYYQVQQRKIEALGLQALVDVVVISDQWGREYWKPHSRPYLQALSELQCQPSEAIYIGDNPLKDFLGARRAGLRSLQIHSPEGVYAKHTPPTREHEPDRRVASWSELMRTLEP
jgi:putative hydrolase of the HAD superfamily